VYGGNAKLPFSETDAADRPLSYYAATKRANELMAYSYSHLFGLPATGLRFFTVYGDWGRPDMAFFSFAEKILAGQPITVFNGGRMKRDFTYGGDVAEAVARLCAVIPDPASGAPHRVVNIATGRTVPLMSFITALENALGHKAEMEFKPHQPGDMFETWADTELLRSLISYVPDTPYQEGIARFARWYLSYRRPG
jgi:UDP-glucuronate 4-epimerase